jgi:Ulp1 family protease
MTMMHTKNLEFPLLVTLGTEVPPDGPPPYSSDDETGDLNFFKEEATYMQWGRYHVWLQEQRGWRRDPDETTAILHGELITSSDAFTLKKSEWVTDNLLHYVYKSQIGVTDPLVAFFASFFFTELYQEGNADPEKADTYSYEGVASWTKKILRATPIDEMKTIVFLLNEGRMHWKCFAIFMDLQIIQVFDSGGSGGGKTLQDLYRWLHSTMEIEGKTLKPAEWRLYCCHCNTPRQRDHDCGLYAIMFAMCVSKRLPLSLIM